MFGDAGGLFEGVRIDMQNSGGRRQSMVERSSMESRATVDLLGSQAQQKSKKRLATFRGVDKSINNMCRNRQQHRSRRLIGHWRDLCDDDDESTTEAQS